MKLYSNNNLNDKYLEDEFKCCYEEKLGIVKNINNNINIDMEVQILEKIKQMDLSTINSNNNSHKNYFLEENSDIELNKVFEINFDKNDGVRDSEYFKSIKKVNKQNKNNLYSNSL